MFTFKLYKGTEIKDYTVVAGSFRAAVRELRREGSPYKNWLIYA